MSTRFVKYFLLTVTLLSLVAMGFAAAESYDAFIMRLLRYDGDVAIEDASGQDRFVMENVRFNSGEAMRTGENSSASVSLDASKILTLDQNSRVEFLSDGDRMEITLTKGTLFLDVSEKLDENEKLDIKTTTMTVGIRGTIVFLSQWDPAEGVNDSRDPSSGQGPVTVFGVLEGKATLTYEDQGGGQRKLDVEAGQKAVLTQPDDPAKPQAQILDLTPADVDGFITKQLEDERVHERVQKAAPQLFEEYDYPANGDWEYTGKVTIIAQSASKLYDGNPLTRTGDILVYGLPDIFGISAYAGGSRTDAGVSENPVAGYTITNLQGEDVTKHFPLIEKVSGQLVVDPAPMTIWTGSATKAYDGTPLTCEEAGFDLISGDRRDEPWRNTSLVLSEAEGETLYGISGSILVHGTNPLTEETREDVLTAGCKLTVHLSDEGDKDSIRFVIEKVKETELPPEILRLYADNPELLTQACEDAGWDEELMLSLIAELPESPENTTEKDGLTVPVSVAGGLRRELTNARINVDSGITDYNGRALSGQEAHFSEIRIDDSVTVTATGSQTEVGESENTYEIDWGTENLNNFIISEELGILRVLESMDGVTVTAASASKVYDGKPLTVNDVIVRGLPEGYTLEATVEGDQTDAGSSYTLVSEYKIFDANGEDVTEFYPNIKLKHGELTVEPAPLTVTTASGEKVYDGEALLGEGASIGGLVDGETAEIKATGEITDAGSAFNTYEIAWGSAKKDNYTITEELGTLTVEPLSLGVDMGASEGDYSGSNYTPNPVVTYLNGAHAGESVMGSRLRSMEVEYRYGFFTGDGMNIRIGGIGSDAGKYTLKTSYSFSGNAENFTVPEKTEYDYEILPVSLTVTTGSAEKPYDGTPLTCADVTVTGLMGADEVTVTPTGTLTDVGSAENTYVLDWGFTNSENYVLTEELGTLSVAVNDAPIVVAAASESKGFDGKALESKEFTVEGDFPSSLTMKAETQGSQTMLGSGDNTIVSFAVCDENGKDVTAYFSGITTEKGVLTVTANDTAVTVVYDSFEFTYAELQTYGEAWPDSWGSITGLPEGIKCYIKAKVNGDYISIFTKPLDVGTYELSDGYDFAFEPNDYTSFDVTEWFTNITVVPGKITISPAPVTVMTGSAQKPYDGTPLTNAEAAITGLRNGETAEVTATGSQTEVGESDNTCAVEWGSAKQENYAITEELGKLTVTGSGEAITITAGSASFVYDGKAHSVSEFTVSGELPSGMSVEAAVSGSLKNAGSVETGISSYRILKGEKDVTAFFTGVVTEKGSLTIDPKAVTVTTGSASKVFDGKPLTNGEAALSGLVEGETASVAAVGAQTDAGEGENSYEIDWGDVNSANYTVIEELGALSVTPLPVTITMWNETYPYQGGYASKRPDISSENTDFVLSSDEMQQDVPYTHWYITWGWGDVLEFDISAGKDVGAYTCSIDGVTAQGFAKIGNYEISYVGNPSTFTISALNVYFYLGGSSQDRAYNEEATMLSPRGYYQNGPYGNSYFEPDAITGEVGNMQAHFTLFTGDEIVLSISGWDEGDVGTHTIEATPAFVKGNASNYETGIYQNTYKVTAAPLTVTTSTESKVFDGTPLTGKATLTGLADWDKDKVTATASSLTDAGSVSNTCTIDWGEVNPANYTITEEIGTLTVEPLRINIDVGSASMSGVYGESKGREEHRTFGNGPHAGEAFSWYRSTAFYGGVVSLSNLFTGDTLALSVSGLADDDAGDHTLSARAWIETGNAENYVLNVSNLAFTVTPAPLTVTTSTESKVFDGTPLTGKATLTGLVNWDKDKVTVTATGTITDYGSVENSYAIDWGEVNPANYTITEELGTLSVEPITLTVDLGSASFVYDKSWHAGKPVIASSNTGASIAQTGNSSFTVSFDEGYGAIGFNVSGSTTNAGTYTLKPSTGIYALDAGTVLSNYSVSFVDGTQTIEPLEIVIDANGPAYDRAFGSEASAAEIAVPVYGNGEHAGESVEPHGPSSAVDDVWQRSFGTVVSDTFTVKISGWNSDGSVGTHDLSVTVDFISGSSANYKVTVTNKTYTVSEAPVTITTGSATKPYDGTPLTVAASITGLAPEDEGKVTVTATGSVTDVGSVENGYTIDWGSAKASNYTLTEEKGTLTVTAAPITVTTSTEEKVYDGKPLIGSASVSGLAAADESKVTVTATGTITDVGSAENTYTINWGSAKAGNYDLTEEKGTLSVTKAALTVETSSASKMYDGSPLTSAGVTVTGLAAADEGKVTVTATGTITGVGSAENTYTIEWGGAKAGNYTVSDAPGTLTVTANDTPIVVTSGDGYMRYKPYDCIVKNSDYTVEGLPAGFTLSAEITGEQSWNVGSSPNTIASWTIRNAEDEDVSAFFTNVTTVEGTLTVDKAIVSIWSDDRSKPYDGTPAQGGTIHWTGIYGTDNAQNGIRIYHANSLTDAGSVADEFTVYWNYPELEELYEPSFNPGTITIVPAELKIVTSSETKPYDGTPLTGSVTVTGLAAADESKVTVTATGTITGQGTTPNTYTIDWGSAKSTNYSVTEEIGTLEITKPTITVVVGDDTGVYDGREQGFMGNNLSVSYSGGAVTRNAYSGMPGSYTYDYSLPNGDGFTLKVTGAGLDVGAYPMTGSVEFTSGSASDYAVGITNGTFTITPLGLSVDIGVTGGSVVYSGEVSGEPGPFTVKYTNGTFAGQTVESDGGAIDTGSLTRTYTLYTNDRFSVRATMPVEVGTHTLCSGVVFASGCNADNFNIVYTNNSLTVEKLKIGVTLLGFTMGYNGTPQTPGIEIKYLNGDLAGQDLTDWDFTFADDSTMTVYCSLLSGDTLIVTVPPSGAEVGIYEITPTCSIGGTASRYDISKTGCTIEITPEPYGT